MPSLLNEALCVSPPMVRETPANDPSARQVGLSAVAGMPVPESVLLVARPRLLIDVVWLQPLVEIVVTETSARTLKIPASKEIQSVRKMAACFFK